MSGNQFDDGSYNADRESDEFRGNENNRRVAERRAKEGDVGVAPDPKRARRLAEASSDVLGGKEGKAIADAPKGTSTGPSPNAPATTTENPAGTTADPQGKTARAGNGGGAPGTATAPAAPAWPTK